MSLTFDPEGPPLRLDVEGVCRVSRTRVTLESVIGLFRQGATPEEVVRAFPSVPLADAYATIAYYLRRREEVDAYLARVKEAGEQLRRDTQSRFPGTGVRERLLARRKPVST